MELRSVDAGIVFAKRLIEMVALEGFVKVGINDSIKSLHERRRSCYEYDRKGVKSKFLRRW